jgi:HAE1 family hydrophobic/amphiphilic exporter-1
MTWSTAGATRRRSTPASGQEPAPVADTQRTTTGGHLAALAVRRPVTVVMTFVGLALFGLFASQRIPLEQFPEVDIPYVRIMIPYQGALPDQVEREVTRPVEEILATMRGIEEMRSFSREGNAFVQLTLDDASDVTARGIEAKELIEGIRDELPPDVRRIMLRQEDPNEEPMMNLTLSDPGLDRSTARELLDTQLRAPIERVPGVNSVNIWGLEPEYVRVAFRPERIAAFGLDVADLQRRLAEANFVLSAGSIDAGGTSIRVQPVGAFRSLDDIASLPVARNAADRRGLRLGDVADVAMAPEEVRERRRANGEPSVGVSVHKRPEANLIEVSRGVARALEEVRANPAFATTSFLQMDDLAGAVVESLRNVVANGLAGALLSGVVLLLFLRRLGIALLVTATVPLAMCATLTVLYFAGVTLNLLSLTGLMLAIGLLVDNSVVVGESIELRRERGEDAFSAAVLGTRDVGLAVTAGTLTTAIVFVPAFMSDEQQVAVLQQNIAVPVVVSLLASLGIAWTLLPAAMARIPPPPAAAAGMVHMDRLRDAYARTVGFTLRRRWLAVALAALVAGSGWLAYTRVPVDMNPREEQRRIVLQFGIRGSLDLDVVEAAVLQAEQFLLARRDAYEIENLFSFYSTDRASLSINLREDGVLAADRIQDLILEEMPPVPEIQFSFGWNRNFGSFGGGGGGSVRLLGESSDELRVIADDIVALLAQLPGLKGVRSDAESSRNELRVRVRPERASALGTTPAAVGRAIAIALRGEEMRRGLVAGGRETTITLEVTGRDQADLDTLRTTPIILADGRTLALEALADFETVPALRTIMREDRATSVNVQFGVEQGVPMPRAQAQVESAMRQVQLPPGYRWELGRRFEDENRQRDEMVLNIVFAVVLIYLLMAALFESALYPAAILVSIGYSLVGVFWFFLATGTTLTSMALTGILLLMGIVVNNGIVLLNRIQQLRAEGVDRMRAIVDSGRDRLRPILMTTATTVVAMLPLAIGDVRVGGEGPSYFPMARAIIGGLVFATAVTLVLLPLLYVLLDDARAWTLSLLARARAGAAGEAPHLPRRD